MGNKLKLYKGNACLKYKICYKLFHLKKKLFLNNNKEFCKIKDTWVY